MRGNQQPWYGSNANFPSNSPNFHLLNEHYYNPLIFNPEYGTDANIHNQQAAHNHHYGAVAAANAAAAAAVQHQMLPYQQAFASTNGSHPQHYDAVNNVANPIPSTSSVVSRSSPGSTDTNSMSPVARATSAPSAVNNGQVCPTNEGDRQVYYNWMRRTPCPPVPNPGEFSFFLISF